LKRRVVELGLCGFLGLVVVFGAGCGRPRGELFVAPDQPLVWPKAPETPRIRYVGMISIEEDLKKEVSWMEGLGELIFGKRDMGVLVSPYAVAIDEKDRLFVADPAGPSVHIFDMASRKYAQFSDLRDKQQLKMPVGLAVGGDNVYVVDSMLGSVCVFDRRGKFLFSFGSERLKRPTGIAYWPERQLIYVADTAQHNINVFDKAGEFLDQFGSRGPDAGSFNFPTHLWIDSTGRLYVSDTLNYRVQVLTDQGRFLTMFGQHGDGPGDFAHPCGLGTDGLGHIYVIDRQFENIQIFDSDGRILLAVGEEGSNLGQFWLPGGICIDKGNRIFVADSFNKRVQVFELLEASGL
jgi:DNA-binding beta-propeller fold protein YncE